MLELIRTAGIFMIIAQTMYHFVSGSKYARYVRLLIRIMTLAVLVVPLLDLVKSGTEADFQEQLVRFEREYEAILQDAEYAGESIVEERIEQTAAQGIKTTIDPVLAPYGYETVGISAGEDGMVFILRLSDEETGEIGVRPVREIRIRVGGQEDSATGDEGGTIGAPGISGNESGGQADGTRTAPSDAASAESALADVIAAYLRVERSWVEVRIVG